MALSDEDVDDIFSAVVSHAAASGYFERVNQHEPKNAPGNGLTCAIWLQDVSPVGAISGLNSTSGRLLFSVRVYGNMIQEPQDEIDPNVMKAVVHLLGLYSGDFSLDGLIKNVDLLGAHGIPMRAQAGYQSIGRDRANLYRIMTITLPLIVNDLWEQVA